MQVDKLFVSADCALAVQATGTEAMNCYISAKSLA